MWSQQLHYHDANVRVHDREGLIWLTVEENRIEVVLYLRDAMQARNLATHLIACADRVEATTVPEAETPAETLASA